MMEFIEELKYNQNINFEKDLENRINIDYVIERLEDIQKENNNNIKKIFINDLPEEKRNYLIKLNKKLMDQLLEESKKVLKDIEDLLHSYEDYPSEDDAIQYADEMERLNDYYIEKREDGTSDNVIRLDVAYTECFI